MRRLQRLWILAFCVALLVTAGCAKDEVDVSLLNDSNMKQLRNLYELYMNERGSIGPKNEDQFRDYIVNGRKARILAQRIGWDAANIDDLFIGERDGQPLRIKYGLREPLEHAIVFEAEGVDGKRLVAFSPIQELDAAEYDAWWTGKKKPKPLPTLEEVMNAGQ